jgi:hypothetical protein
VTYSNSSDPNGFQTGNICDEYVRTGTGARYYKTSGTGTNTGWVLVLATTPAALTKTDDTNVTLTLGGSPSTALINAASITVGWNGLLSVARGGTGIGALTTNGVLYGNNTSAVGITAAGGSNTVLTANGGAPSFSATPTVTSLTATDLTATNSLTTLTVTSGANLTLSPVGDIVTSPTGTDILPDVGYRVNIGALSNKYLKLHAAELWIETLVAQDTMATIGGRVLVAPTTLLTTDITTADIAISVKHNQMDYGDRARMEADGKVEFFAIGSTAGSIYRANVLGTSGLVGFWRLGEPSGTTMNDELPTGAHNGTYFAVTLGTTGALTNDSNTAATFNGSSSQASVTHASAINPTSNMSIELWVKPRNAGNPDMWVSKFASGSFYWYFRQNNSTTVGISLNNDTTNITYSCINSGDWGVWTHYVLTYDTTNVRLYKNGSLCGGPTATTATGMSSSNTGNLTFGWLDNLSGGTQFAGVPFDEIALYTSVLSSTQVAAHYNLRTTATVGYSYAVTRDLDSSGADVWYAGDAVLNTGTTNDGYIDLYSLRGALSGATGHNTEVGPTIVGMVRTSPTYYDVYARWAIGNLNGWYGYGADTYGFAAGDSANSNITVDATNGIRIRNSTTVYALMNAATFRIGAAGGKRLEWDNTTLTVVSDYVTIDNSGIALGTGVGINSSYSVARALRYPRPATYGFGQTGDIYAVHATANGTDETLLLENVIKGNTTSAGNARVTLNAQGWNNGGGGSSTTAASMTLLSQIGTSSIALNASSIAGTGTLEWGGGATITSSDDVSLGIIHTWTAGPLTLNDTAGDNAWKFSVSGTEKGRIGLSGSWLGSSATDLILAAASGGAIEVYPNAKTDRSIRFTTDAGNGMLTVLLSPASSTTTYGAYTANSGSTASGLYTFSQGYTSGGASEAASTLLYGQGDGGINIQDYNAVGGIEMYEATTMVQKIDANGDWRPDVDNSRRVGLGTHRYTLIRGVTITSGDLTFENGWTITESDKLGIAEPGLAILNANGDMIAFIGEMGLRRPGGIATDDIDSLAYVKTTAEERSKMDIHPEQRVVGYTTDGKPVYRTRADVPMPDPKTGKTNKQRKGGQ